MTTPAPSASPTRTPTVPLRASTPPDPFPFVPPTVDPVPDTAPTVDITPLSLVVAEYARLQVQIAELKEIAELQRKHIEQALGEKEVGLIDGKPAVTYKYVTTSRFDITRFRKAHPDLAEEFLTESHSRRFVLRGA